MAVPRANPPGRGSGFLVLTAGLFFLPGCFPEAKPDATRFYRLTPIPADGPRVAPAEVTLKVRLREIELPAYLNSKSLVVLHGPNELVFEEFHRWAEPLEEGIGRVVGENLQVLGGGRWVRSRGQADFEIALRIIACEGLKRGKSGASNFAADWQVTALEGKEPAALKRGAFEAPGAWDGKDHARLVERLSEAIGELSRGIASVLEEASRGP